MTQRTKLIFASLCVGLGLTLGGCSSTPQKESISTYQDYKNKEGKPAKSLYDVDVSQIPDAEPREEPFSRYGNKSPYVVFGETYNVLPTPKGYKERGIASWYGPDFHGKRTSSWETYDMFRMTAAHKSLPLPCYAKVTNLQNGKHIIVKVNDRGPFHDGRIIDLSFAAAKKLDMAVDGTAQVEVEALNPDDFSNKTWMDTIAKTNAVKIAPGVTAMPANPSPAVKADATVQEPGSSAVSVGAVATATKLNAISTSPNAAKVSVIASAPASAPAGTKAVHLGNGKTIFIPVAEAKPAEQAAPVSKVSHSDGKNAVASKPAEKAKVPAVASKNASSAKTPNKMADNSKVSNADKAKSIYLQVGAYAQRENAELLKNKLNKLKLSRPVTINNDQSKHRVQVGPFETEQLAMQMQQRIRDANMGAPLIVRN